RGRSIEGSGIGLALVQELVRLHGGTIRVESALDTGSAFVVSIPLGTSHLPSDRLGQTDAQAPSGARALAYVNEALGCLSEESSATENLVLSPSSSDDLALSKEAAGRLVLLADDNADMRAYVQRLLQATGFRVRAFPDGEAALAAIRTLKPDLV